MNDTTKTPATDPETPAISKKRGRPTAAKSKKRKKTAAKPPAADQKPTPSVPEPPPVVTETAANRGPGRPPGPTPEKIPEVVAHLTRCKKCNSTERAPYYGTVTREISGVAQDGGDFNKVTWKRTKCENCQQARTDVFHELVLP
jgi:hypothetical protein